MPKTRSATKKKGPIKTVALRTHKESSREDTLDMLAIGLEEQEKSLASLVANFNSTHEGNSCVLSGRCGSGKSLVLKRVLAKEHLSEDNGMVEMIDCWEETTSTSAMNRLANEMRCATNTALKLIVVDHFERFNTRRDQKLLYSILNACQQRPWFVVMLCTTEDAIDSLEKRIKSRLSKTKINFNISYTLEQREMAFFQFLEVVSPVDIRSFRTELEKDRQRLKALLKRIGNSNQGLRSIKQLALVFALTSSLLSSANRSPLDILEHCAEALCPRDEMLPILRGLSLRQLCILRCITLLQKDKMEYTCREVHRKYSKFCNEYEKGMTVEPHVLYRDIDELIRYSVLVSRERRVVGQVEFRKVTLDVEADSINECLSERNLPTSIKAWMEMV